MVVTLLKQYLSPEQVSNYLRRHHQVRVSHETIYHYIFSDKSRAQALKPYLRQGKKLKRKRYGSGARASLIPNRISIQEKGSKPLLTFGYLLLDCFELLLQPHYRLVREFLSFEQRCYRPVFR